MKEKHLPESPQIVSLGNLRRAASVILNVLVPTLKKKKKKEKEAKEIHFSNVFNSVYPN